MAAVSPVAVPRVLKKRQQFCQWNRQKSKFGVAFKPKINAYLYGNTSDIICHGIVATPQNEQKLMMMMQMNGM